jgi:hypothetical protein
VNSPKLSLRRSLAVLGATFVGIAAALAISAPASAHEAILSGDYKCLPSGQWEVTWTLASKTTDQTATLEAVAYEPANPDAEKIVEGATLKPGEKLTETVLLPGDAETAGLFVGATFANGHKTTADQFLEFAGDCKKEDEGEQKSPSVTFDALCDGSVDVILHNPTREAVMFTVDGKRIEVAAESSDVINVTVDDTGEIVVTWGEDGKVVGRAFEPACPTIAGTFTCDQLIVEIENPAGGRAFEVTLQPEGGAEETIGVEAGNSVTREYDATEGFSVQATAFGVTDTFVWEQPEACGGGGGGGGEGPTLPVTGAAAGGMAAGAALLLAIGAGLFLVARRRRVRFTA